MVRRLSLLSYLVAGVAVLPMSAWASANVTARANAMEDYTRIVLDFEKTPSYIADQKSSSLKLTFQNESNLSAAAAQMASAPRVKSVSAPDGKNIQFSFTSAKDIRHFTIGNRVIIDVYGDTAQATKSLASESKSQDEKSEKTADKDEKLPIDKKESKEIAEKNSETPKEQSKDINEKIDDKKENVVEVPKGAAMAPVQSVSDIMMAVYQTGNAVTIVVNQPDFKSAPIWAGDDDITKKISSPKIQSLPNATAFSYTIPAGMNVRAEGGGSNWRILLSPKNDMSGKPTPISRVGSQLEWKAPNAGQVIQLTDPMTGDDVSVIPVSTSSLYTGLTQNFIDVKSLPASVGAAFIPKRDQLNIVTKADKVVIGDGQTLSLSSSIKEPAPTEASKTESDEATKQSDEVPKTEAELTGDETIPDAAQEMPKDEPVVATDNTRYFELTKWQQGGVKKLESNRQNLLKNFLKKTVAEQADTLISLAKLEIANGMGAEAIGYLDYAVALVPELEPTPTVTALYGASELLIGHNDDAFQKFADEKLAKNAEIQMWRAVALARLEDWAQAGDNMPAYPMILETYPTNAQIQLGLTLAEIALRNGNPKDADKIMELISKHDREFSESDHAALNYLRGESDRQKGKIAEAKKFWEPLTKGHDDLYRVKAGLSLTNLQLDKKEITPEEAIDRLEGFRYTWRGDELETAVNFRLGRLYIEKGDAVKGLNTLRQAASLSSPESDQSTQITELMKSTFKDLFLTDKINDISPVDAVTIYEEFAELTPADEEGNQILDKLSSRLVDVDLLPRAAALLTKKIDQGAVGVNGADTAIRLADIMVMDRNADKALEALVKADEFLKEVPVDQATKSKKQIALLRAEAYSLQKKPDQAYEALSLLAQDEDVLRRRADIAWDNERWQDSADALEALVQKADVSPSRPVSDEQAELLLNWAIALHKAENKFVLADIRDRFSNAMAASPLNEKFEIITRPKQNSVIVDRASIDRIISEVEMFKKAGEEVSKTESSVAPVNGAAAEAATSSPAAPVTTPEADGAGNESSTNKDLSQGEADVAGAEGAAGNAGSNSPTP